MSIAAFLAGFVVAFVLNFAIALGGGFSGSARPIVDIVIAWAATIVVFAVMYRMHPWAAYGALACYVALFVALVGFGGATGPYLCFGAYGYPNSSR